MGFLVPAFRNLLLFLSFLDAFDVGQDQFRVDYLDVADGVDRIHYVFDIRVFEAADHLDDRVHLPDMPEKLISEAFTGARAFGPDPRSTNSKIAGIIFCEPLIFDSTSSRSSGTVTIP